MTLTPLVKNITLLKGDFSAGLLFQPWQRRVFYGLRALFKL